MNAAMSALILMEVRLAIVDLYTVYKLLSSIIFINYEIF